MVRFKEKSTPLYDLLRNIYGLAIEVDKKERKGIIMY